MTPGVVRGKKRSRDRLQNRPLKEVGRGAVDATLEIEQSCESQYYRIYTRVTVSRARDLSTRVQNQDLGNTVVIVKPT
ncbi:hypothetical protein IF1G_02497 [Cordyceps javanica]|uniref:Uncharacterized protein n=1 Tax=Cordyceps javanica TaxID=43265 RepID=A0A545V9M3_9HYPO|nr:hypothetical protein IF1G_02497 [Cordyceps javanica]